MNPTLNLRANFSHVTTVGDFLPYDILHRVLAADDKIPGLKSTDYGLAPTERISEAINRSWQRLILLWLHFEEIQKNSLRNYCSESSRRRRKRLRSAGRRGLRE